MSEKQISSAAFADTKPHYNILDGLLRYRAIVSRGVIKTTRCNRAVA